MDQRRAVQVGILAWAVVGAAILAAPGVVFRRSRSANPAPLELPILTASDEITSSRVEIIHPW